VTLATVLFASAVAAQPAPPPPPPTDYDDTTPPAPPASPAPPPPTTDATQAAAAAPVDPYGGDPVLSEQIAEQLVTRAQELFEAKIYVDAKQLAVEALVKSPKGTAADRARHIIKLVNLALNIKDDPAPTPPSEVKPAVVEEKVDLTPISEPAVEANRDVPSTIPTGEPDPRIAGMVHGGLYAGLLGATIGGFFSQEHPMAVAVPMGLATAAGGAMLGRFVVGKLEWNEAQVRTAGSAAAWAGAVGGLLTDAATGAGTGPASGRGIMLGASIGATAGLAAGGVFARKDKLTRGDVALVDTLAGIGAVGGLTVGMLMQPKQKEAYAVNSLIGIGAGVVTGMVAAPQTNTTPRRMLRVAGLSAAGGAVPFLLYAGIYDSSTKADERVVGVLSSLGLVAGAYVGFRLTRGMDEGLDGRKQVDDAPAAAVGRNSDGSWTVGSIGIQPLSSRLASDQRGMTFTLLGATF
jgi:hypothetical protein